MAKTTTKYSALDTKDQKEIQKKIKKSDVHIVSENDEKTIILPEQVISYNSNVITTQTEKTILEFIGEQKDINKYVLEFIGEQKDINKYVLEFIKEQKEFNQQVLEFMKEQRQINAEQKIFNQQVLEFMKEQREVNKDIYAILERNNLK